MGDGHIDEHGSIARLAPAEDEPVLRSVRHAEFDDQWTTRQCEIYRNGLSLSSRDPGYFMCDQPLARLDTGDPRIAEITPEEFEQAWRRSGTP